MVGRAFSAAFVAAALAGTAYAGAKCSRSNHCPQDAPCCGLYGECGVGAFCMGGCDPSMSFDLDSCVPAPVCQSTTYKLDSLDKVADITKYLGDASQADWQSQGMPAIYTDPASGQKSTLLTMAKGTVGTLLASTHYVWYGKICAKLATSQGKGVVTAFILMSDIKDEIDYEWVGTNTAQVQSNYYSQGNTVYTNSANLTIPGGDSVNTVHEYCVDWTTDQLTWTVDGNTARTLKRQDTWNSTSGRWDYPQTPARIMLSLWPAGLPSNAKGTVDWAGGEIDWNSPYMQNGYYFARFQEVSVKCYDPPAGAQVQGSKSYHYSDAKNPTNSTVQITDKQVILGSLTGTGDKPGDPPKSGSPQPSANADSIPGGVPGGGQRTEQTAAAAPGSPQASGGGDGTGFSQGSGNNKNHGSSLQPALTGVTSSLLALAVGVVGLIAM